MVATAIQIKRLLETGTKLRAIASITLDDLIVIHDIKILEDGENLFLAMPSKAVKPTGFKDIVHPINSETRQAFEELIFSVYKKSINEDKLYVDVKFKYDESDNLFSQNSEEYEVVNISGYYNGQTSTEHNNKSESTRNTRNDSIKRDYYQTNSFIKWLKS